MSRKRRAIKVQSSFRMFVELIRSGRSEEEEAMQKNETIVHLFNNSCAFISCFVF